MVLYDMRQDEETGGCKICLAREYNSCFKLLRQGFRCVRALVFSGPPKFEAITYLILEAAVLA